jgi:hypothetical protein
MPGIVPSLSFAARTSHCLPPARRAAGRLGAVACLVACLLMLPASRASAAGEAPPLAAEVPAPAPARPVVQTSAVPAGSPAYAAREAAATALEQFEGGGVGIYIGGSTLAIVLLIVLLVVLL